MAAVAEPVAPPPPIVGNSRALTETRAARGRTLVQAYSGAGHCGTAKCGVHSIPERGRHSIPELWLVVALSGQSRLEALAERAGLREAGTGAGVVDTRHQLRA